MIAHNKGSFCITLCSNHYNFIFLANQRSTLTKMSTHVALFKHSNKTKESWALKLNNILIGYKHSFNTLLFQRRVHHLQRLVLH